MNFSCWHCIFGLLVIIAVQIMHVRSIASGFKTNNKQKNYEGSFHAIRLLCEKNPNYCNEFLAGKELKTGKRTIETERRFSKRLQHGFHDHNKRSKEKTDDLIKEYLSNGEIYSRLVHQKQLSYDDKTINTSAVSTSNKDRRL